MVLFKLQQRNILSITTYYILFYSKRKGIFFFLKDSGAGFYEAAPSSAQASLIQNL